MEESINVKIGKEFKPAPQFKRLYYIYFFPIFLAATIPWYLPVLAFAPVLVSMILGISIITIMIVTIYWIPKYYDSIKYKLTGNEMEWRRGVWFKNTGIVPYNRITNVDISQGPVSRSLGIAALKIQTAGYSAPNQRSSEIKIEGVEQSEELRELIMSLVRGRKPVAVETYESEDPVLNELIKIRKLLEKSKKK